jgi:hypothetical protein
VSIKGGSYARFQHALRLRNIPLIRAAAAELPYVDLTDALGVCLVMSAEPGDRYERAAARWLARLIFERPDLGLADLDRALSALRALPRDPQAAKAVLRDLCRTYRISKVVGLSD